MKENLYDLQTDVIIDTLKNVRAYLKDSFKGTNPYRMVKEPDSEAIAKYLTMTPEIKKQFQQIAPESFGSYEDKITKAMGRYTNAK